MRHTVSVNKARIHHGGGELRTPRGAIVGSVFGPFFVRKIAHGPISEIAQPAVSCAHVALRASHEHRIASESRPEEATLNAAVFASLTQKSTFAVGPDPSLLFAAQHSPSESTARLEACKTASMCITTNANNPSANVRQCTDAPLRYGQRFPRQSWIWNVSVFCLPTSHEAVVVCSSCFSFGLFTHQA